MPITATSRRVRQVRIETDSELEYRWSGGATVNIYREGPKGYRHQVDVFSTDAVSPTFDDIVDSVERREACIAGAHSDLSDGSGYCPDCGAEVDS